MAQGGARPKDSPLKDEGRTIHVSGIKRGVSEETLLMYFESKRKCGGGDVDSIQYEEGSDEAIITFEEASVASRVLGHKAPLTLEECQMTVQPYVPPKWDRRSVLVSGITEATSKNLLELYFENKRRSGGADIESFEYAEEDTAVVTFTDEAAAKRVLDKPHSLEKCTLTVSKYCEEPTDPCTIYIEGINSATSRDTLLMHFESKRQTSGGPVKELQYEEGSAEAVMTFEEEEVAKRVLERYKAIGIEVESYTLVVSPKKKNRTKKGAKKDILGVDMRKVRVLEICKDMTSEKLSIFFESKRNSGGEIEAIDYTEGAAQAIITFAQQQVAEQILSKSSHTVCGNTVLVKRYSPDESTSPASSTPPRVDGQRKVQVRGIPKTTSEETLMVFFENRRLGGGAVDQLDYVQGSGEAVIAFSQGKVAANMIAQGTLRPTDEIELSIMPYEERVKVPDPGKILVRGISVETGTDILTMYLENKSGGTIKEIHHSKGHTEAVVTFDNPQDVEQLIKYKDLSLGGSSIELEQYMKDPDIPNKLVVQNINPATTNDGLRYFFESRTFGRPEVADITYLNTSRTAAVVTFLSDDVVQSIIERKEPIVYEQFTFTVSRRNSSTMDKGFISGDGSDQKDLDSEMSSVRSPQREGKESRRYAASYSPRSQAVMINNISPKVTYPILKRLLEKHITSVKLKKLTMSKDGSAVAEYPGINEVQKVLSGGQLKTADGDVLDMAAIDTSVRDDPQYQGVNALIVSNIPENVSKADIKLFFENRKLSGSSEVSCIFMRQDKAAVVSFSSHKVLEQVLDKQKSTARLVLKKSVLTVERIAPPSPPLVIAEPVDPSQFILLDVPTAEPTEIKAYFSRTTDLELVEIFYSYLRRTVKLEFDGEPDYRVLLLHCYTQPLRGQVMTVQRVRCPTMIQVQGVTIDEESLGMYFESTKDSGGADLTLVEYNKDDNWAVIDFNDHQVVERVLKQDHVFNDNQLEVFRYYPELGISPPDYDPTTPWSEIPDPITILLPDERIYDFISSCQTGRDLLEQVQSGAPAFSIVWNECSPKGIRTAYYQTPGETCSILDSKALNQWKDDVSSHITSALRRVCLEEIYTLEEVFLIIRPDIDQLRARSDVVCTVDSDKYSVVICGLDSTVASICSNLKAKVDDEENQIEYAKQVITKTLSFKDYEVSMFIKTSILETLNQDMPNVQVKQNGNDIVVSAIPTEIKNFRLELLDKVTTKIKTKELPLTNGLVDFLQPQVLQDKVEDIINQTVSPAVILVHTDHITLATLSDGDLKAAEKLLKENISEKEIGVDDTQQDVMTSPLWQDLCKRNRDLYKDEFKVIINKDNITVLGLAQAVHIVLEELKDHLAEHTILEQALPSDEKRVQYIKEQFAKEIRQIEDNHRNSKVNIQTNAREFVVRGTKFGIHQAAKALDDITSNILTQDHPLTQPWAIKNLQDGYGEVFLQGIEKQQKVKLELVDLAQEAQNPAAGHSFTEQLVDQIKLKNNCVIKLFRGDLTAHKCGAIVNAANSSLEHGGGLAKAIVDAGGVSIQDECRRYIQRRGRLLSGNIYIGSPGRLPCKRIIHAVGPEYNGGRSGEANELYTVITESLEGADREGLSSIAIPAVSTGIFGYPLNNAIQIIAEAILEFLTKGRRTTLQEVHFMDDKANIVNIFKQKILPLVRDIKEDVCRPEPTLRGTSRRSPRRVGAASAADTNQEKPSVPAAPAFKLGPKKNSIETPHGLVVTLVRGDLVKEKVESLVNTTAESFDLNSGHVSAAILQAAGPSIQAEATNIAQKGVGKGAVVETSGGKITGVKAIYHGTFPGWDTSGKALDIMRSFIKSCLLKAGQYSSIAIPAIGTGNLNYPRDQVARCLFERILEFSRDSPLERLRDVRIVVYEKDTTTSQVFEQYMEELTKDRRSDTVRPSATPKPSAQRDRNRHRKADKADVKGAVGGSPGHHRNPITVSEMPDGSLQLCAKSVVMTIKQGDITAQRDNAIINPSNAELSLDSGGVSLAILQAGGSDIQNECNNHVRKGPLKCEFVRTHAGRLHCDFIYHLVAPEYDDNIDDYATRLKHLLKTAEKDKLTSLSLPALGTGIFANQASRLTDLILEEIVKFVLKVDPKYLRNISIVIRDDNVFALYKQAAMKDRDKTKSWLQVAKQWIKEQWRGSDYHQHSTTIDADMFLSSPSGEGEDLAGPQFVVRILAMSQDNIDSTIAKIEQHCDHQTSTHYFNSEEEQKLIAKLTDTQKHKLQAMAKVNGVRITIEQKSRINRIVLEGSSSGVIPCIENVRSVLSDMKHAETLQKQVLWEYDCGDGFAQYPADINCILEEAFTSTAHSATWEQDDGSYEVIFDRMVEVKVNDPNDQVAVTRRILGADTVSLPGGWTKIKQGQPFHREALSNSSSEYKKVFKEFDKTCNSSSYDIVSIERVQSPDLYQSYMVRHKHIKQKSPQGLEYEKRLFHGTTEETVSSICRNGFNRGYCGKNAAYYGDGVYFAVNASYSSTDTYSQPDASGHKYMFQCRVLTGQHTQGQQGVRVLPPIDPQDKDVLYDSLSGQMNGDVPATYVIFHDSQAYPEYLIMFKTK